MVISEFLASLGLQDNFSGPLDQTLVKGEESLNNFKNATAKQLGMAGISFVGFLSASAIGIMKFSKHLIQSQDDIYNLSKELGISQDKAFGTKMALDAMGKSYDEIQKDHKLLEEFKDLRAMAQEIKPPDMSDSLEQVKDIGKEFTKSKQLIGVGIQWIGHYFLKYVQKPLNDLKEMLSKLNKNSMKALPKLTEAIGKAMAWVVRLISRVAQVAGKVWKTVGKILDKIPDKVKLIGGALATLGLIMKSGPMGIFIALISLAMLLLDDFFTFLEGGESLFGDFWQKLVDSNALQNFKIAFEKLGEGFEKIMKALEGVLDAFFKETEEGGNGIENFFLWLLSTAIPNLIGSVGDILGVVGNVITKLNEVGATKPLILSVISAFLGFKAVKGIKGAVDSVKTAISGATKAFSFLNVAKIKDKSETLYLMALYAKDAVAKGISTAATFAQTAATTAWNVVAGIATTVTTAFGAAVAFLTSPIGLVILAVIALIAIVVLLVKNWDKVKEFFINLWDKIKETFSGVGEWFKEKFDKAKEAIVGAFNSVIDWVKSNWKSIVLFIINPFAGVFKYLYDNFEGFRDFVDNIISAIVTFFLGLWEKIKETFSNIGDFLKKIFIDIPSKLFNVGKDIIKSMWDGILSMGSWLKDKVTGFFSGIWDGVKGIFGGGDGGDKTPDPSGGGRPPTGGGHADGGIFDKEHVTSFAEGNKPEAIVPLTKPKRAMEILGGVGKYLGLSSGDTNIIPLLEKMFTSINNMSSNLENMNNILNSMQNISTSSQTIVNNNQKYEQNTDISVYDNSGNSQQTGNVVYNNQTNLIRDLKAMGV